MGWRFLKLSIIYTTEGIILKRFDVAEADSLFVIYTKDFGKIQARAQGVKKSEAKLKGHLEPLSLSYISFVSGRNGERLTSAILINPWPSLRNDGDRLSAAWYVAGLVGEHCMPGEKDGALWNLLLHGLLCLEKNKFDRGDLGTFLNSFETGFCQRLGYGGRNDLDKLGHVVERPI